MFARVHRLACECIRRGNYVVTIHAEEEMTADGLSIFDVENAILTGSILLRQRDLRSGEWKYVLRGKGLTGLAVGVVMKVGRSSERKLVILTVFGVRSSNGKRR